ncbi:uncharacterized protein V1510DRAFT_403615 [Dipodascopsis tothii]|uniref:uncharacterized protein n=1 Tax=Dipodascopsis tothii TaxID=44089 RepID=UPI0034CFB9CD
MVSPTTGKFVCDHDGCGRAYLRLIHLTRHKLNHDPIARRFQCELCLKTFVRQDLLRRHRSSGISCKRHQRLVHNNRAAGAPTAELGSARSPPSPAATTPSPGADAAATVADLAAAGASPMLLDDAITSWLLSDTADSAMPDLFTGDGIRLSDIYSRLPSRVAAGGIGGHVFL